MSKNKEEVLKFFGEITFSKQEEFDEKYTNLKGVDENLHKLKVLISFSLIWNDPVNDPITTFPDYAIEKFTSIISSDISDIDLNGYDFKSKYIKSKFDIIETIYLTHCEKMESFSKEPIPKQIFYCIYFVKLFLFEPYSTYEVYNDLIIPFAKMYKKQIYVHHAINDEIEKIFDEKMYYHQKPDLTSLIRHFKIQELF